MSRKAELDAKRNALVLHIIGLNDAELAAVRIKELAARFGVYWKVVTRQVDIEEARRRACKAGEA